MDVLFSSRAAVTMSDGLGESVETPWPFGRVILDSRTFTVHGMLKSFEIPYEDIEYLRFHDGASVEIFHHAANVFRHLTIHLPIEPLREAIVQYNLSIPMEG